MQGQLQSQGEFCIGLSNEKKEEKKEGRGTKTDDSIND